MILRFSVENWMSFKKCTEFSMIATRERQHKNRVTVLPKYQSRVLPIAAIYGGNASGKTNFFKALSFVKKLIVSGVQPDAYIPIEPYRLSKDSNNAPSRFSLEILVDEIIYEYSFAVTRREVIEERLVKITSSSEKVLYHRKEGKPNFHESLRHEQFLQFAFQGTRDNQLFLTNSVSQKVNTFKPVYDWFKQRLELVGPDSRFQAFEHYIDESNPLFETMNEMLPKLDTGISSLKCENIPFDKIRLPEELKSKLQDDISEGDVVQVMSSFDRLVFSRVDGELVGKKLVTFHSNDQGDEIKFGFKYESDGTMRVIDLLPLFLELSNPNSDKVYVVDEIDRSLHSLLTKQLLELYLSSCHTKGRAQLLFTTHDTLLMDQSIFRRDEMWVAERDYEGVSQLISFSDYNDVRYDKDIRKSYLSGRLGGIPRILMDSYYKDRKDS